MIVIGTPTPAIDRLISALTPVQPAIFISQIEPWTSLANQARATQKRCILINLDDPKPDFKLLGPLWVQPYHGLYVIGITRHSAVGYSAFKNGFSDIYNPGELPDSLVLRYRQSHSVPSAYLYFESGKKKLYLRPNEILYLKADNYTTDLYLTTGQRIPLYHTLKKYAQHLPACFLRIQKSVVINTQFLYAVESSKRRCWLRGSSDIFTYSTVYIKHPSLLVRYPENLFDQP